jgi:hypothetical protein
MFGNELAPVGIRLLNDETSRDLLKDILSGMLIETIDPTCSGYMNKI